MSDPSRHADGIVVVSRELIADAPDLSGLIRTHMDGIERDLRGERLHGPHRTWCWESEPNDYLESLTRDELLAEAIRLKGLVAGLVIAHDDWDPNYPDDVRAMAGILRPAWKVTR